MSTSPINFKDRTRPFCTVDAVIIKPDDTAVLLIERAKFPLGLALPGGHIEYGESAEQAVKREVLEECGINIALYQQFYTYSLPERDPRSHTMSIVYIAYTDAQPKAGDDAAKAYWVPWQDALNSEFAFDHKLIIEDVHRYLYGDGKRRVLDPRYFKSKYAPQEPKVVCTTCGNEYSMTLECLPPIEVCQKCMEPWPKQEKK